MSCVAHLVQRMLGQGVAGTKFFGIRHEFQARKACSDGDSDNRPGAFVLGDSGGV